MTGRDAAERKRDERERMRDRGFVLKQFWVHPSDWERVKAHLEKLLRKRGG